MKAAPIKVYENLYIGGEQDSGPHYDVVIRAAKKFHRETLGYTGNLSKSHQHYRFLERPRELILNLVDADSVLYIDHKVISRAIQFIHKNIDGNSILVHCEQGVSRAPSIGFLYLMYRGVFANLSFADAILEYLKIYPRYRPNSGIFDFVRICYENPVAAKWLSDL